MADDKKKEKKAKPEAAANSESAEPKQKVRKELKPKVPTEWERRYLEVVAPKLREKFGYKNVMEIPKLQKIVINTSFKEALQDVKLLHAAAEELGVITGQKPAITKAKKSISNFKLRKGQPLGAKVTLRGASMYEFMNRFVNVALPRVRDFKGVPANSFDGKGNYTMGLTEQTIFPEVNFDKVTRLNGMNLTFVTSAKTDEESAELLKLMGMPFRTA